MKKIINMTTNEFIQFPISVQIEQGRIQICLFTAEEEYLMFSDVQAFVMVV
jgi:uncharacterized protein (UPF0254 family)